MLMFCVNGYCAVSKAYQFQSHITAILATLLLFHNLYAVLPLPEKIQCVTVFPLFEIKLLQNFLFKNYLRDRESALLTP